MPSDQSHSTLSYQKLATAPSLTFFIASLLVGIILAALDFGPRNIFVSTQTTYEKLADIGVSFFNWAFTYILIDAVVVVLV